MPSKREQGSEVRLGGGKEGESRDGGLRRRREGTERLEGYSHEREGACW